MRTSRRTTLLALTAFAPAAACEKGLPTAPAPPNPPAALSPVKASIVIRGTGTIASGLSQLDIENIEIVKGPVAATLYGKRCDMIIRITTSRPRPDTLPTSPSKP